jgi:hypothetical protein
MYSPPPGTLIIFAHSPAGFGHLRVTLALQEGLEKQGAQLSAMLGTEDSLISSIHRATSVTRFGLALQEWFQHGFQQKVMTYCFRSLLQINARSVINDMETIVLARPEKPKHILVVATHFGPAHKIAKMRREIEERIGISLTLVVQVTDDSPLCIWYVPGADMTCVPSEYTKRELQYYAQSLGDTSYPITALPYPISPHFSKVVAHHLCAQKQLQVQPHSRHAIHVAIPISGAAVGLNFYRHIIIRLNHLNPRFVFHVIVRDVSYTKSFIKKLSQLHFVRMYTAPKSIDVVKLYEKVYKDELISLEITKPSEQAFKALEQSSQRGGSVLLFTFPVGRQEYDNISFLRSHDLIPGLDDTQKMHDSARSKIHLDPFRDKSTKWRGIPLPPGSHDAARFIEHILKEHILESMTPCKISPRIDSALEVRSDGVHLFWQQVNILLTNRTVLLQ